MIIDFHTHAFPEAIAEKALNSLKARINREPNTDGTADGLLRQMDAWGIDMSVVCNIATNARQMSNVNSFAIETAEKHDRLIPLGSINPDSDYVGSEMKRLLDAEIKGIKIHPDYMGHDIDSRVFDPIFEAASALDMFVITHAGFDVCSPDHIYATPAMLINVIKRHPKLKLVAAHFGGNMLFDEVKDKLCGKSLWIDTSLAYIEDVDPSLLRDILTSHDPDKILFGSDAPWCPPDENVKYIESFDLGSTLNEKIFEKNARALLGI